MDKKLEDLIENLTKTFEETILNEEKEKKEIVLEFKKYLNLAVETIQKSNSKFIRKDYESIESILSKITNDFKEKDITAVKSELLKDSSFDKIRGKSLEIFEIAKECMKNERKNTKTDLVAEIEEMKKLFNSVKEYNKRNAQELISEAIVDLKYITSLDNSILSLRLYRFNENLINNIKEER